MIKQLSIITFIFCQLNAGYIGHDPTKAGLTGDKLIQYTKALWFADKHDMPFVYSPFEHSDKLQLHYINKLRTVPGLPKITIKNNNEFKPQKNVINLVSYYYKDARWSHPLIVTTWKGIIDNEKFLTKLKQHIAPAFEVRKHGIPTDRISVAVHVRKGNGGDLPLYLKEMTRAHADKVWPIKFPPNSYYITQIRKLSALFDDQPMYVYIFTDATNPIKLVRRYQKAVGRANIIYECIQGNNSHPRDNHLQDFFAMTQYDCLIRGGSNFSQMVHLIGDFKVVTYLKNARWHGNNMILDVGVMDNRTKTVDNFSITHSIDIAP